MTLSLEMPEFQPNTARKHVEEVMRKTTFLDIETSLLELYSFRLGMQRPNIESLKEGSQTKLLTAAWGTWWDMYHGGREDVCLLYTSPSPRDQRGSRMPSSA